MLKGTRKLDNFLTNWCHENGFNVKCKLSTDFEYESSTKTVYYSLAVPPMHNELFYKYVCKPLLNKDCDNAFLLSLFHEIGHEKTESKFDDIDMDDYYDMVEKLNNKKKLTRRDYNEYYFNNVEYAATEWGCKYINTHIRSVNNLYNRFLEMLDEFYMMNGVEVDG